MSPDTGSILVVDEERAIAEAIRDALVRRGHSSTVAGSTGEALVCEPPSVLVVDVHLGGTDGLELAERMLARTPRPHLILTAASPTFDACRRALQLGAVDFLRKPFRIDELVAVVDRCLEPTTEPARVDKGDRAFLRTYSANGRTTDRAVRDLLGYGLRCGIGPATRSRIGTALAEIVSNACRHAYPGGSGKVEVSACVADRSLRIYVRDEGVGFDPITTLSGPRVAAGDCGFQRARALCEELLVESALGGGTLVDLHFHCARVDFDEGTRVDLSDLDFLPPILAKGVVARLNEARGDQIFHLSPATAVTIGRLLAGQDPAAYSHKRSGS